MSQTGADQFVCEGCGRSYRWKPEFAGRKVKCKCGQVMIAPAVLAPALVESVVGHEIEEEELYSLAGETKAKKRHKQHLPEGTDHCPACDAFLVIGAKICVQCGYDLVTGKAPPKPTAVVDDGTTAMKDDAPPPPKPAIVMPVHRAVPARRADVNVNGDGSSQKKRRVLVALTVIALLVLAGAVMTLRG